MKRIVFLVAVAAGIVACDKVEKPYQIKSVEVGIDTPSFPALEAGSVVQKYLFEDYTGHLCTNCPDGARILKELKAAMGDTLIVMAVHAGVDAMVKPNPSEKGCSYGYAADYRTPAGNEYASTFNVKVNPSGMLNRTKFKGNPVLEGTTDWASSLNSIERKPPTICIQIIPIYSKDMAYVFVKTTLLADMPNKLRLCAVLAESGIIAPQKNGKPSIGDIPDICDYEHNHVLRTAITSAWGDAVDLSQKNDTIINAYALPFTEKSWKKENCGIIVYIYDDDTKEILQVEEAALLEE